jgi:hypothetical protein
MSQLGAATPGDRNPNADLFFFFKVNYNLEYRLRYGLITKLLVLFEIKNFQMSNSLTDGPTFTFIQTDYVQRM